MSALFPYQHRCWGPLSCGSGGTGSTGEFIYGQSIIGDGRFNVPWFFNCKIRRFFVSNKVVLVSRQDDLRSSNRQFA